MLHTVSERPASYVGNVDGTNSPTSPTPATLAYAFGAMGTKELEPLAAAIWRAMGGALLPFLGRDEESLIDRAGDVVAAFMVGAGITTRTAREGLHNVRQAVALFLARALDAERDHQPVPVIVLHYNGELLHATVTELAALLSLWADELANG